MEQKIEIPDIVKKMIKLEGKYNTSILFFENWKNQLEKGYYKSCPEYEGYFAKFINYKKKQETINVWSESKEYLKDKDIRDWVINQIDIIIKELKLQEYAYKRGTYPKLKKDWKFERDNKDIVEKVLWLENCSKCNREGQVIGKMWNITNLYRCPICKKFFCARCMSRIKIHTSDLSCYNSNDFDLENVCKICLGKGLINSVTKLMDISVKNGYRSKNNWIKIK